MLHSTNNIRPIAQTLHILFIVLPCGEVYFLRKVVMPMKYDISTPYGVFEVLQQLTYGEMIIGGILTVILVVVTFKAVYDIADREGFI